jgi:UPF0716 family protein affecting phage T7 exclusion
MARKRSTSVAGVGLARQQGSHMRGMADRKMSAGRTTSQASPGRTMGITAQGGRAKVAQAGGGSIDSGLARTNKGRNRL